jgi:hypothetical protein
MVAIEIHEPETPRMNPVRRHWDCVWWLCGGLEPVREKVEFGEAFVIVSPALLLRRRADVES